MRLHTKLYLAAPFFNMPNIGELEELIEAIGFELFSPRRSGITLRDLPPEERKAMTSKVFRMNVAGIESSDVVLAVIDGRDTGTVWEMGFAYATGKPIYTYTAEGHGVNVMLQGCTLGHAKGMEQLKAMLHRVWHGEDTHMFTCEAVT